MSSSFQKNRPARQSTDSISWSNSFRFRGSLFAAFVVAGLVFASGKFLERQQLQSEASEIAANLITNANSLSMSLQSSMQDANSVQPRLQTALRGSSDLAVQVFDLRGEIIAKDGPPELLAHTSLALPRPLQTNSGSALQGKLDGNKVVEVTRTLNGPLGNIGTLQLRKTQREVPWIASLFSLAGYLGIFAGVIASLALGRAFRPSRQLLQSLDRVAKSDFSNRVPVCGSGELRAIAKGFNNTLDQLEKANLQVQKVYVETALAMSKTVEAKDKYTSGHSQRVSRYCVEMGEWLGFDYERLETMRLGALLHDIGKVAVSDDVLLKQGPLDDDEFEEMRGHPMAGDRILGTLPGLRDIADIARCHHERWDGKGYPLGAKGESIPLEGRICAIADAYDALTTKRSYKEAMPFEKALAIIEKDAGTHFDPELARLFVSMKRNGKGYKSLNGSEGIGDNQRPNVQHPPTRIS